MKGDVSRTSVGAGIGKNLVEHPAHGEDGWAGVEGDAAPPATTTRILPPGAGCRSSSGHRVAGDGEVEGGGQAADAGADDDDCAKWGHPRFLVDRHCHYGLTVMTDKTG